MSSQPLGWRGFSDSDNTAIRAFGITRLFAIFAIALAIELHAETLLDRRFALAVALGIMITDRHRVQLKGGINLSGMSNETAFESRVEFAAIRIVTLAWLLFAVFPSGWISEQLRGIAMFLTVTKYVAWNHLPHAIRTIQESLEDAEPMRLRRTWHEFKKISLRSILSYLSFLATITLICLLSQGGHGPAWMSPYTYTALFCVASVMYHFLIVAVFGRSLTHLVLGERIEVTERSASSRSLMAMIRAIAINLPLLIVVSIVTIDVYAFGQMPRLGDIIDVLYMLAILFYGAGYFHRDRRGIHDIIAGTIVVRPANVH